MEENFFWRKVDKRRREDLVDYLQNHFRYYTMNSWNGTQTFANNVKITNMGLTRKLVDCAFDVRETRIWCAQVDKRITEYTAEFPAYLIRFNGRSSGYMCLLAESSWHQFNQDPAEYADPKEWDMEALKERTEVVQAFDHACDLLRGDLIYYCQKPELVVEF